MTSVLLHAHEGQWVAYHGEGRVGFGGTQAELYHRCQSIGLRSDEFIVHQVGSVVRATTVKPAMTCSRGVST